MLITCNGLQAVRLRMKLMYFEKTAVLVPLQKLVHAAFAGPPEIQLQLILDPLSFMKVKSLAQTYGHSVTEILYYFSRTFVYYLNREKLKKLQLWPSDFK